MCKESSLVSSLGNTSVDLRRLGWGGNLFLRVICLLISFSKDVMNFFASKVLYWYATSLIFSRVRHLRTIEQQVLNISWLGGFMCFRLYRLIGFLRAFPRLLINGAFNVISPSHLIYYYNILIVLNYHFSNVV